jgi:predicted nucleic acid-binding Zn ribbon protein
MSNEKCDKCGAEIPMDSKFCLNCGAKVVKETRTVREPIHQMFHMVFSKNMIIAGILLGLLFLWIGVLVMTFSTDTTGYRVAMVLNSFGFFLTGIVLIGGGIANDTLEKYVRLGMVVIGVYMITVVLSLPGILSSIRNLIP